MHTEEASPPLTSPRQPAGQLAGNDLTALLQKAAAAIPSGSPGASGRRWVKLLPVFRTLIRRGFGGTAAVDWLIEQGEICKEDRKRAFYALRQALHRRNERLQPDSHARPKAPPLSEPAPASSRQF